MSKSSGFQEKGAGSRGTAAALEHVVRSAGTCRGSLPKISPWKERDLRAGQSGRDLQVQRASLGGCAYQNLPLIWHQSAFLPQMPGIEHGAKADFDSASEDSGQWFLDLVILFLVTLVRGRGREGCCLYDSQNLIGKEGLRRYLNW